MITVLLLIILLMVAVLVAWALFSRYMNRLLRTVLCNARGASGVSAKRDCSKEGLK